MSFRIPVAFIALMMMGVFVGLNQGIIYKEVGAAQFDPDNRQLNVSISLNLLGLSFLVGADQFITCSFAQVLTIPLNRPLFVREVSNRMYSGTPYYLALATSSVFTFVLYPIVASIPSFYFFELEESSIESLLNWMGILMLCAISGAFWGYALGTLVEADSTATSANMLSIMVFCYGAGIYANTAAGANLVVQILSYISPIRYSCELLLRRVLAGKLGGEQVLEAFGFEWGSDHCMMMLVLWTLFCFIIGWIVIVWKTRQI